MAQPINDYLSALRGMSGKNLSEERDEPKINIEPLHQAMMRVNSVVPPSGMGRSRQENSPLGAGVREAVPETKAPSSMLNMLAKHAEDESDARSTAEAQNAVLNPDAAKIAQNSALDAMVKQNLQNPNAARSDFFSGAADQAGMQVGSNAQGQRTVDQGADKTSPVDQIMAGLKSAGMSPGNMAYVKSLASAKLPPQQFIQMAHQTLQQQQQMDMADRKQGDVETKAAGKTKPSITDLYQQYNQARMSGTLPANVKGFNDFLGTTGGDQSQQAGHPEGTILHSPSTGKMFRIQGGQPVPMQ
jgi:hypothetical protein